MHKLIIEDDEGRTTVVPLVRDELTIGRKEGNTIRLTERNVSRRHARLYRQNGEVWVEDFGSYTGVRLNGVRISAPVALKDADQVLIGDYKLAVRSDAAAAAIPSTVPGLPAALSTGEGAQVAGHAISAAATAAPMTGTPSVPAGTPRHLDAAPTIPLRTLEEQGRAPNVPMTQPARLVVVTTDLAGVEFRLDRASLVIGRTEENDIILNHPSISRHHAKVVRDGDRYTVVDLQSANGVRVAGESYERVDVQPGDVIELGHVKLRFVGALEEWAYNPGDFAPRSRRGLKVGAALGGVALAAILIVALRGKKEPPPPPAPAIATPKIPAGPSPEALYADAQTAVSSENWDKAVSALDLLLSRPAGDPAAADIATQALSLKRKVDLERRSAETFASFQKAVADQEPDVAISRFDDIPPDSVYKPRAEPDLERVKPLFLAAHLELADAARAQGRCDDAAAEVEKVQQMDPENKKARDIVKRCRPKVFPRAVAETITPGAAVVAGGTGITAVPARAANSSAAVGAPARAVPAAQSALAARPAASAPPPRATTAATAAARPVRPATTRGVATNTASDPAAASASDEGQTDAATDLIRQAREAWMRQQCPTATELSRRALKAKPSATEAHQIIAVCACSSKDKEIALRSYTKLDERSRAMVRALCARNGVELVE